MRRRGDTVLDITRWSTEGVEALLILRFEDGDMLCLDPRGGVGWRSEVTYATHRTRATQSWMRTMRVLSRASGEEP